MFKQISLALTLALAVSAHHHDKKDKNEVIDREPSMEISECADTDGEMRYLVLEPDLSVVLELEN